MPNKPLLVNVLLCEGFSNLVLACALEPLRVVRDQRDGSVDWSVLTIDGQSVHSSSGLNLASDGAIDDVRKSDVLIVISGYGYREHACTSTSRQIRRLARASDTIIGVDTGAWLLAAAGLLQGREATIHWQVEASFADAFPSVRSRPERFVRDGRLWTGGGASTVLDLMTVLIEERFGTAIAFDVSTLFLHDSARQFRDRRGPGHLNSPETPELHTAINCMVENIEKPASLAHIARAAGLSLRTMHRQFMTRLGMPPGRYYQSLRLARAKDLAETTDLSMQQLAVLTGFSMPATLSRAYKAHFGTTVRRSRSAQQSRMPVDSSI
ncbi:GlxA family transcriptional regulator [Granulosicoccus sp. 3-233]|uniref:GlxA family transcriptional regulator n=1 Tax=Granulosicoccus sp. 3-233 TaxID=3417969 RepID=UPI003D3483DA